ncbi:T9SS type B sorting domain-containing protein [Spirosoma validum]|uniref:Gliding motility-associated C-terminal domain-containing protein n=1 Tax=Spirosoma validum TaxID=2771355 RepID=A0A927B9W3_9BACT|nr:gliding motility-associated C-terminal domain-containing protein [Spirosoma validum]MBD2757797.1 gliding motility-associated C-terminal domain-containing protein [Spirosoma validum]
MILNRLLFLCGLLLTVTLAQGQVVKHSYRFYNFFSVSESECGPDLTQERALGSCNFARLAGDFITDTIPYCAKRRTVYHTNLHWGLKYPNSSGTVGSTYTIHMYVKTTNWGPTWARIIDFSNGLSDNGIYFKNSGSAADRCIDFYPSGIIGPCPYFNTSTYYLLTFTRNGQTGIIDVYVNDKLFVSYNDAAGRYVGKTGTPIYIFRDDQAVSCESGEANFAYLSFTNQYSSQATVNAVYNDICSIANTTQTVDFALNPTSACSPSQRVTITYTGDKLVPESDYTVNWNWDGGKVISGSGFGPYVVNWPTSGTKSIKLTVTSTSCGRAIAQTRQLTVGSFSSFVSTTNASCGGANDGSLTINAMDGSAPYQYSIDSVRYQAANTFNVSPGAYTAYVKDARGCITNSRATVGMTNALKLQTLSDTSICPGQAIKLVTTSDVTNFSWLPITNLDNPAVKDPVATPLVSTTYVVTATNGTCSGKDTVRVTVLPPVQLSPQSVPKSCGTFVLSANSSGRVQWTGPGITGSRANQDTLVVTVRGTATYKVRATDIAGTSCTVEKDILVNFAPPATYRLAEHVKTSCGTSTVLEAPKADVWDSFRWQSPDGTIANQAQITAHTTGKYSVLATSSSTGCESRDTVAVNFVSVPAAPVTKDVSICAGDALPALMATGTNIRWFSDSTLQVQVGSGNTLRLNVSPLQPIKRVYFLTQSIGNTCTSAPAMVSFEIKEVPAINLPVKNYTGCFSTVPVDILTLDAGNTGTVQYKWYDPNGIFIDSSRTVNVQKEGVYSIQITNHQQCSKTGVVTVAEFCSPMLFAPDAFTPNHDNLNDVFEIKGKFAGDVVLFIYNRWGELILKTNKPSWDGYYRGELCPTGEYTWLIEVPMSNPGQQPQLYKKTGHVLLLK